MKVYLDSSVVLAFLLEGRPELRSMPPDAHVASSRLLWIETARVIERAVRSGSLGEEDGARARMAFESMAEGISCIRLTDSILERAAGSFPVSIRTLDALHVASAMEWAGRADRHEVELWSFDRR